MRLIEFKMERPGLLKEGQDVTVSELAGTSYNYIIDPAVAMSGCYSAGQRLQTNHGIVKEVKETDRGFYVTVEFNE